MLSALNIFFQETSNATDVTTLTAEDFHKGNTKSPVEITVTFSDLSEAAKEALGHYVRHDQLVVTTIATFDPQRWSRLTGQNGGLAKVDFGFDYAANFSSVACVA